MTCAALYSDTDSGLLRVTWTPPENPQFDIDYYRVRVYKDGQLYTSKKEFNELEIDVPFGIYTASVSIVSTCGTVSSVSMCETVRIEQMLQQMGQTSSG